MIEVKPTGINGVIEIVPKQFGDDRGFFSETFNAARFAEIGLERPFVQDNHSLSRDVGVLRGLHYQLHPFAQDKLVRVTTGRVLDVAVDIRKGSPSYGEWVSVELSAEKWNQLYIPRGFAHGFVTLEPNTEFLYKVTNPYSPEHDRGIRFDDPTIGVDWILPSEQLTTSEKDRNAPLFGDAENTFVYEAG